MTEENGIRTGTYYTTGNNDLSGFCNTVYNYATTNTTAIPNGYITHTVPLGIPREVTVSGQRFRTAMVDGRLVLETISNLIIDQEEHKEFEPLDKMEFEMALKELLK